MASNKKGTKDEANKRASATARNDETGATQSLNLQGPTKNTFRDKALASGITDASLTILEQNNITSDESARRLSLADINDMNISLTEKARLMRFVADKYDKSAEKVDIENALARLTIHDGQGSGSFASRRSSTGNSTASLRKIIGISQQQIQIVLDNMLTVERYKDILRDLGLTDGTITGLHLPNGHNPQKCLKAGIDEAINTLNIGVDDLIEALEATGCGMAAGQVADTIGLVDSGARFQREWQL